MKLLITGGAGFIGKWLVEKLPQDAEVIIVDSLDEQVHRSQSFDPALKGRAKCIKADIQLIEEHKAILEGIDTIVHLAAQTGTGQSMYEISKYVQHNANGTAKLLEFVSALDKKPRRIILASSRAVYGEGAYTDGESVYYPEGRLLHNLQNGVWEVLGEQGNCLSPLPMQESQLTKPTSVYGLTKLWQEQLLQNYCESQGIDLVTLRFQNVYGPKQELQNPYTGIIGIFTSLIVQDKVVELFEDGLVTRDFVFVEDVAEAVLKCVLFEKPLSSIINIGSGQATSLVQLVETIGKVANREVEFTISGRFRIGDVRYALADMSNYEAIFEEWKPTSLEAGLTQYLEWYLNQDALSENKLKESLNEMERKGLLMTKK
jgi:dTDP-L-rhamnose 4-epimerase